MTTNLPGCWLQSNELQIPDDLNTLSTSLSIQTAENECKEWFKEHHHRSGEHYRINKNPSERKGELLLG